MRYAIFTDIHANLEALEAVLAAIDKIDTENPIDQIWFLGDLVGYGPNPNECITKLRKRTDIIIAGNHDWAAVGKLDLEDFSTAARISAEWTAEQLTEEHRAFLAELPEHREIAEFTLVHGSPYGPLWEYLTSEVLAERSFQYFHTRYCVVGHTHVPVIFQQPDSISNAPTLPLVENSTVYGSSKTAEETASDDETTEMVAISPSMANAQVVAHAESAYADPETGKTVTEENANEIMETKTANAEAAGPSLAELLSPEPAEDEEPVDTGDEDEHVDENEEDGQIENISEEDAKGEGNERDTKDEGKEDEVDSQRELPSKLSEEAEIEQEEDASGNRERENEGEAEIRETKETERAEEKVATESTILHAEDRLNQEIEELLDLLGLSESMLHVTNEMMTPPEGHWELADGYRAIINCGGVGQPRDGDPRAAFMIYDTEHGFGFYRVPYPFNKTQEKIIRAGLPQYLAVRLAYGR